MNYFSLFLFLISTATFCQIEQNDVKHISPVLSLPLDKTLHETSGLIYWNKTLLTLNDDTDFNLYAIDTLSGKILKKYPLPNEKNTDWEEIAQDSLHIYIGDFGNNVAGNRKDLHILKIEKQSLLQEKPIIETIHFSFSNQTDFTGSKPNKTDFDCEAMLVAQDSIYLFTKQWISKKTSVYSLPKTAGNYVAQYKGSYNVDGLLTGATFLEDKKLVAFCGYSTVLKPFVLLLYDYPNHDFFSGKKLKIKLSLPLHQVEGIATHDGLHYYCTNEDFTRKPWVSNPQQLHYIDLSPFLQQYVNKK